MADAFSFLSNYYDSLMTNYNYDKIKDYILSNINGSKGVDLACGSGRLTIELKKAGYSIIGIDKSKEMLNVAMQNAKLNGVSLPFIYGDINNLNLSSSYDFVLATCDVVNYINPDSIDNVFSYIYNHLTDNGVFIFDFSSSYKLNSIIGDNVFYEDHEDLTFIWDNQIKNNYVIMDLIYFAKENDKYTRYDERHIQYVYDLDTIIDKLKKIGFINIEILDGDTLGKLSRKSLRNLIRAGK